jgi:formylglycine-generating enzyme required for sulfatase activity
MTNRLRLILAAALLMAGCAEEGSYRLHVVFEDAEAQDSTAEVAIWALEPGGRSCDDLVSGRVAPEDMTDHSRLVVQLPPTESEQLNRVPAGRVLFFVAGRTDTGAEILRGCTDATVKAGATVEVTVLLEWFCRPRPEGEIPGNDVDDDCDGETDECEQNYECDDDNACTTDLCASGECYNTEVEGVICNDGDPCTGSDVCSSGVCAGQVKDCSQFDGTCVLGRCDPVSGECGPVPDTDGSGCQDGLYCTEGDTCLSGTCTGSARDCADADACTRDDCDDTADECTHLVEPLPGAEGPRGDPTCSDGQDNDCDGDTDALDVNCGVCAQDSDCDDSDVCTQDVCDIDQCRNDPEQDGTQCDDGAYCTVSDECAGGVCGGTQRDCSGWSDDCHQGVCVEAMDQCGAQNKPNGTGCDDGLYCTAGDVCTDGSCAGVARDCSDTDICTDDSCSEDADVCEHVLQPNPGAEGPGGDPTCSNGVDDDCDGDTDGQDSDCGCTPQCGIRECGPDPACQTSCGECDPGESCTALGRCVVGEWIEINPGTFQMGSPDGEPGQQFDESRHLVELSRGFVIWSTEVSQEWYQNFMGVNPSDHSACGWDCPVERVSWHDAAKFCNALSDLEGYELCYECTGTRPNVQCNLAGTLFTPYHCSGYRLPTEAEWEYTARAGTGGSTYNGIIPDEKLGCQQPNQVLDPIAWFCGNSGLETRPSKGRDPNDWELYDTLGNVWEWCQDWYDSYSGNEQDPWGPSDGMVKVQRGGYFNASAGETRAAYRATAFPDNELDSTGFRPVRSLP